MPVKLEKHILRKLFSDSAIAKKVMRQAEYHGLVLTNQGREIRRLNCNARVRNVPSQLPSLSNTPGK